MKPKLLVIQLWNVGDLAIASPFLRQASEKFDVSLLAKPYARDLQGRFWPPIKIMDFNAPWTAFEFNQKYKLYAWPWRAMFRVWRQLRSERFDVAVSARWDPRDHLLLRLCGAKARLGFPRMGSQAFLTRPLARPPSLAHQYEYWRVIARALDINLEDREKIQVPPRGPGRVVLVHTGAGQPVRVWPLERYLNVVRNLRATGRVVRIICNPEQRDWWLKHGESSVATPETISGLLDLMSDAGAFIGNDSGPGHLAAFTGIPTFTLFGPQVPEWWVPLHPAAEWHEGRPCPYKPCSDYCMFPKPYCLQDVDEDSVWPPIARFVAKHLPN